MHAELVELRAAYDASGQHCEELRRHLNREHEGRMQDGFRMAVGAMGYDQAPGRFYSFLTPTSVDGVMVRHVRLMFHTRWVLLKHPNAIFLVPRPCEANFLGDSV